jgi:uncharacterized protein
MRYLLAIHDVWPGNFTRVAGYLERLRSWGARRIALLVVPAYHGAEPMDRSPDFVAWLRAESARGCDLFLHGHYHLMGELAEGAAFGARRGAWGRFVNRRLVEREAEFCGLPRAARARLLGAGLEVWRRTGLPLAGFVAPTWHGAPAREDLRAGGIDLCETRFGLAHLPSSRAAFVPPLAWGQSGPARKPVLMGGEAWLAALLRMPLLKVALHPGDLEAAGTEGVLARVFAAGENVGYGEVFGDAATARRP